MKKCINLGCPNSVHDKQFCCSQDCGYTHYIRKTINELNVIADREHLKSFEFTPEQGKLIIDGYKQGKIVAELAVLTGSYVQAVQNFLFNPIVMANFKIHKRRKHRRSFSLEEQNFIKQDIDNGIPNVEIAANYKASITAVHRFKVKYLKERNALAAKEATISRDDWPPSRQHTSLEQTSLEHTSVQPVNVVCRLRKKLLSFLGFNDVKREQKL